MVKILPSVLSADFAHLGAQIKAIEEAGADMHHVDVMDGHFVPNISFGSVVVDAIAAVATKPLDLHLMISEPEKYLAMFTKVQPELITIHAEATTNIKKLLQAIRASGAKAGLSIKPGTAFSTITEFLPFVDVLLIMTVEPGFGGQAFMQEILDKIRAAAAYIATHDYDIIIEADGGINQTNVGSVVEAGAKWIVAGSSVYTANQQFAQNIQALRTAGVK